MKKPAAQFFGERSVYVGDIHNHCGISYGHGSLEEALANAQAQLDFAAVTGHAGWPDMGDRAMGAALVDYHESGFDKLHENWPAYTRAVEAAHRPGEFVTFFSFEFHSFRYGDRTIITPNLPDAPWPIADPDTFGRLLTEHDARDSAALLLPHHIGYRTGYRGIDWDSVRDAASPLVEILSMHGLAEEDETGLFPYMHTMGPLHGANTMQAGLAAGHHFGVTASTDHHAAHPGSYGYGRTAVWAEELTREAIWQALLDRRTYALSGDRIELRFAAAGAPLGSAVSAGAGPRLIEAEIRGGGALDRVEVLKNNRVIHRVMREAVRGSRALPARGILFLEFGWGAKGEAFRWDIDVQLHGGELVSVEPRLRGVDVVDPLDDAEQPKQFSEWRRTGDRSVHLETVTTGNATATTRQTQGVALEIEADDKTRLSVSANGSTFTFGIPEVLSGSETTYTGGFGSPAIRVHRFVTDEERSCSIRFEDEGPELDEDWYYLRVYQTNGQAAWSSPVWVSRS